MSRLFAVCRAFLRLIPIARACVAFAAIFALCACAADEPEIAEIEAVQLLIQDEAGGFSRALSVFALFNGGGTADDFAMMTVTHEATGIFWEVPAASGFVFSGGNELFWVGSSSLSPIPSILKEENEDSDPWGAEGFFPKGTYTVTADNAAGSSASASFALDASFYFAAPPAAFRLAGEGDDARWNVVLSQDLSPRDVSVYLFLLNEAGSPLSFIRITQERFRGRRADGKVAELAQSISSTRDSDASIAAVCCYVAHSPSSSGVLFSPISLGQKAE